MTEPVKTEDYWNKVFKDQRRERLAESIFEYLSSGDEDVEVLRQDLAVILADEMKWAEKEVEKRKEIMELFNV